MALHRLTIDDFEEEQYKLLAIHCSNEGYHLAFLMNQNLQSQFHRTSDLNMFDDRSQYERYEWFDCQLQNTWVLLRNRCSESTTKKAQQGLFSFHAHVQFLLPEFSKADYLLRMDNEVKGLKKIVASLQQIPQVITAYEVPIDQLKSKNNLIFD